MFPKILLPFFLLGVLFTLSACAHHHIPLSMDIRAEKNLASAYIVGISLPKDGMKAVEHFSRAAEFGSVDSMFMLGLIYRDGFSGVPQNYSKAETWFRKAAAQGNNDALLNIGLLYMEGKGVPKDLAEAYVWFQKAADQKNYYAPLFIDILKESMTAEQLEYARGRYIVTKKLSGTAY